MNFPCWQAVAGLAFLAIAIGSFQPCLAGDLSPETQKAYEQAVTKGFAFLTTKGRAADSSFSLHSNWPWSAPSDSLKRIPASA